MLSRLRLDEKPDPDFHDPTQLCNQMWGMFSRAEAFNQPLSTFDTTKVEDVSLHCAEFDLRNQILTPYFYPTCYQMWDMFANAYAFNQPLSTFDTAGVTRVSLHLC